MWPFAQGCAGSTVSSRATPECVMDKKKGPSFPAAATAISPGADAERKKIQPLACSGPMRKPCSFAASLNSDARATGYLARRELVSIKDSHPVGLKPETI